MVTQIVIYKRVVFRGMWRALSQALAGRVIRKAYPK